MDIRNKYTLVTGGAKRIGKSIALRLARQGASILLHYRDSAEEAKATAEQIKSLGVECHLFQCDLADEAQIRTMVCDIQKRFHIDILINSASLFFKTDTAKTNTKELDSLLDVNLKAPFILSTLLGTAMSEKKQGKIINIADWSAFKPYKDYSAYCSSKGGLVTLTKALARDLAPHVMVNAIAPGPVLKPSDISDEEAAAIAKLTVLGHWGTPEDIANAVYFLLENDFINASVLVVDGGRSITL